jgi:alkylation response protein AidB-like acyl-CoA dehydrogenase
VTDSLTPPGSLQDPPLDSPEMAAFRHRVRRFLEGRLAPKAPGEHLKIMGAGSDDVETGRAFLKTLAEGGLAVPTWPERFGGIDATPEQAAVVAEELGRFDSPDLYPFMVGIGLVGPTLMTHGTDEQLTRWLPPIRDGAEIWCQLFSEPDAGSDLAGLAARAERDGDTWYVTGAKVWSSRAHYSKWGLLLARTDPTLPKHAGITAFALDMEAPGVEVRPLTQMNGDTHFNEVFMDRAPVADTDRIGQPGEGWRVAITCLTHERNSIGQGWGSVTRQHLIELARATGAAADPVRRQQVARLICTLEVNRMTTLRAKAAARAGRPPGPEGSGAKIRNSEFLRDLGRFAVDVLGPAGVVGEGDWQTLFLTGPSFSIRGGTDEIQRNIVGERVLGLPPEPRVDKDQPFRDRSRG